MSKKIKSFSILIGLLSPFGIASCGGDNSVSTWKWDETNQTFVREEKLRVQKPSSIEVTGVEKQDPNANNIEYQQIKHPEEGIWLPSEVLDCEGTTCNLVQ